MATPGALALQHALDSQHTLATGVHMGWCGLFLMLLCCLVMAGMQQSQKLEIEADWGWGPPPHKIRVTGPREQKDERDGWGPFPWQGLTAKQAGLPVDPWTGLHKDEVPVYDIYVVFPERFQILSSTVKYKNYYYLKLLISTITNDKCTLDLSPQSVQSIPVNAIFTEVTRYYFYLLYYPDSKSYISG